MGFRPRFTLSLFISAGGIMAAACFASPILSTRQSPPVEPINAAFFDRKIRPILQRSCLGCHGVDGRLAGLDLRSREAALKGGLKGPALIPGNAEKSLLFKLISGMRAPQMPPGGKLPKAEIATLKTWLDGGAPWSGESVHKAAKQVWWSFKPPARPRIPEDLKRKTKNVNPIDAFVFAKLRESGLGMNPPAARRVLIRRAYLDMIGLPPTPEEVRAFELDRSPDAWAKVVDRLLASPHYGERWGRHWLDVVRYADSSGFANDYERGNAWRYRDYVIRSFNADKPYDRFIREQIAGDEIAPDNPEMRVAVGFLRMGPWELTGMEVPKVAR